MSGTNYLTASSSALQLVRGASKTLELTVLDEAGDAFDLSGCTLWFTVKKAAADQQPVVQKKSDDVAEIQIVDAREGRADIYLLPADTFSLPAREYVFDVWVVSGADRYIVVGPAALELQDSVTRIH